MSDRQITLKNKVYIYKLTSPTNKIYIGQSKNINCRFSQYKHNKCKAQPKLYYALKKYGWDNFSKEILECVDINISDDRERFWIKNFNCIDGGLNCENGGRINKTHCKETRNKLRTINLGKKHSIETKNKIRTSNLGKSVSSETRNKISIAHKGMHPSDETIEKIRSSLTGKKLPPRSKEWCEKIKNSKMGKKLSEETKLKISKSLMGNKFHAGKKHSDESKLKIRNKKLGKKHSEETKEKIKKSIKFWHLNKKSSRVDNE